MNISIIGNILNTNNTNNTNYLIKQNDDIKYLLSTKTRLELLEYELCNLNTLNIGDNIILLKKNTLKIHKCCQYLKHDNKHIYLKNKHKETRGDFFIFYKHIHTKKNMFKYLLESMNNGTLEIK